jgi:hypothetical protein
MRKGTFTNADVDSIEEIFTIDVSDAEYLFISFLVGTANLSAFEVCGRAHPDGGWAILANAGANFTSPAGNVVDASGDLTTAASGSTVHWVHLSVGGIDCVRLRAAGTNSTITGHYGMQ